MPRGADRNVVPGAPDARDGDRQRAHRRRARQARDLHRRVDPRQRDPGERDRHLHRVVPARRPRHGAAHHRARGPLRVPAGAAGESRRPRDLVRRRPYAELGAHGPAADRRRRRRHRRRGRSRRPRRRRPHHHDVAARPVRHAPPRSARPRPHGTRLRRTARRRHARVRRLVDGRPGGRRQRRRRPDQRGRPGRLRHEPQLPERLGAGERPGRRGRVPALLPGDPCSGRLAACEAEPRRRPVLPQHGRHDPARAGRAVPREGLSRRGRRDVPAHPGHGRRDASLLPTDGDPQGPLHRARRRGQLAGRGPRGHQPHQRALDREAPHAGRPGPQ